MNIKSKSLNLAWRKNSIILHHFSYGQVAFAPCFLLGCLVSHLTKCMPVGDGLAWIS